ncbi:hypothetical protein [Mailhella sp.]|uniref:hypothetical protein n=1 Tax=Mailhella sp. TaxID=1981029 RepID=UPI00406428A5
MDVSARLPARKAGFSDGVRDFWHFRRISYRLDAFFSQTPVGKNAFSNFSQKFSPFFIKKERGQHPSFWGCPPQPMMERTAL